MFCTCTFLLVTMYFLWSQIFGIIMQLQVKIRNTGTLTLIFDSIIMLSYGRAKIEKEEFNGETRAIKIWDIYVDNTCISKLNTKVFDWIFRLNYEAISFDII